MNQQQTGFSGYQKLVMVMLVLAQFSVFLDFTVMSPLGDILMKTLSLKPDRFGIVVSAYAFSAGISGFLTAGFADRFDRKNLLLFFYFGFISGTVFCGVANTYLLLVAARIITGLFGGVIASITTAIVADLFAVELRGRAMGYLQIGLGASQLLGIPIGLLLANHLGWQAPFVMVAILSAGIALFIIMKLRPIAGHLQEKTPGNPLAHLWKTLSNRDYQLGFLTTGTLLFGGFMLLPFLSSFLINNVRITKAQLPIVYIVTGIASLVTMPVIGKLSDKKDKFRLLVIATAWTMLLFVIYTNLPITPLWVVLIINALMMMGVMSRLIPAAALTSILPIPRDRGAFMSINSSVQQLAGGIAALTAGAIVKQADKFSPITNFNVLAYISIVVSILCIYIARRVNAVIKRVSPAQGQLLVRVNYAAVNPVDNTLRKGGIKEAVKFPKTLGDEGSGVVVKGDFEFPEGARVIISCMNHEGTVRGIATPGCWQEYVAVYPDELMMTPDAVSDEEAAAFPVGFLSAYVCLEKAGFTAGKSVLSIAVGGAVGNAGIQLARAMGASQVITTAGSAEKAKIAADAGFDNIIDLTKEKIAEGVARITGGRGVDIAIDMLGGNITGDALDALAKFGVLVGIGYSAGTEFTAKMTNFVWKGIQLRGASLSNWPDPEEHRKAKDFLLPLLAARKIQPTVAKTFHYTHAGDANRYMIEDRPFGKVLLKF